MTWSGVSSRLAPRSAFRPLSDLCVAAAARTAIAACEEPGRRILQLLAWAHAALFVAGFTGIVRKT